MASNIASSDGDGVSEMVSHLQADMDEITSIISNYDLDNGDIQIVYNQMNNARTYINNSVSAEDDEEREVLLRAANRCLTEAHNVLNDPDKEYSISGHDAFENLQSSVEYLRSYLQGITDEL